MILFDFKKNIVHAPLRFVQNMYLNRKGYSKNRKQGRNCVKK